MKEDIVKPHQAGAIMTHVTKVLHFLIFHSILTENQGPRLADVVNVLLRRDGIVNEIGGHVHSLIIHIAQLPR